MDESLKLIALAGVEDELLAELAKHEPGDVEHEALLESLRDLRVRVIHAGGAGG